MRRFTALHASSTHAKARIEAKASILREAADMETCYQGQDLWVLTSARHPLPVREIPSCGGVLVGDLFPKYPSAGSIEEVLAGAPRSRLDAVCKYLLETLWGRYVLILPEQDGSLAVFRDPMGSLDCALWRSNDVTVATSHLSATLLGRFSSARLDLDRRVIAGFIADSGCISGGSAVIGVHSAAPGALTRWPVGGRPRARQLWRPTRFTRSASPPTAFAAAQALSETLDHCVSCWAGSVEAAVAEISGGLDSALVGSALKQGASAPVRGWINFYSDHAFGDERLYATAVSAHLGVDLTVAKKQDLHFDLARLDADGPNLRPSLNRIDQDYDAAMTAFCADRGATAIFTGQGGDAVLFQAPSIWLAADHLRRRGLAGLASRYHLALARWTGVSIWRVIAQGLWGAIGLAPRPRRSPPAYLSREGRRLLRGGEAHPWLASTGGLAPAKRLQVEALAHAQVFHGDCMRRRNADLIHPMLSQPLVELCLALPADLLTTGGRDRGLARKAFEARLPSLVLDRQTKGDLSPLYGQAIARDLDRIRPFLLAGRLAHWGLLDLTILDAMLDPDLLIEKGVYADLMDLLAIEAWVRSWDGFLRL